MIRFVLLAAIITTESTLEPWIDQLREADRLSSENRHREAETAYIVARKQAVKFGADELPMVITLNHMGHYYQSSGRLQDAERAYAAAFAIAERTFGAASENGVKLAIDLSNVYLELDQVSRAEALIRGVLQRSDSLSTSNRVILLADLASTLARKRKFVDAESLYQQALAFFDYDSRQEFRERTIIALSNLSTIYVQMERFAEGRTYSDRARALLEKMPNPPPLLVFKTMANAAVISAQAGKPEQTDFLFQSAITFSENILGRDHYLLGNLMNSYSEFLRKLGRRADARTAKNRANAILDSFSKINLLGQTVDARAFR